MSTPPPGGDRRGGARRILPSVAEVAAALARRVSADPAVLYRVSREVVTEELTRVKQGLEAAPLEELVARAEERFRALHREVVTPKQPDLFALHVPAPPPVPERPPAAGEPVLPAPYEPPEEPFAAATSADLGWDRSSAEVPPAAVLPPDRTLGPPPAVADERSFELRTPEAADVVLVEAPEERAVEATSAEPEFAPDAASRRSLWILALAAVVVVAAGLFWVVTRLLAPPSGMGRSASTTKVEMPVPPVLPPASAAVATPVPTPMPAPAARPVTAPVPSNPAPGKSKSAPAPAARPPAAPAPPPGRVASFVTRDWAGHPPVFIIHFASHQDRAAAAADAAKLASAFGKPARAVEVDLGAKGIWYRVVVGEFPSAEEARTFRAALEAKKTPGLGFVYEMRGAR